MLFARDLFAALRGEAPTGASAGPETDADLARALEVAREAPVPRDATPPLPTGHPPTWARVTVHGPVRRPLPRLAAALAARCPGRAVVDVPVDLRRHLPDPRTTANFTGLVRLRLEGPWTEDRVAHALAEAMSRKEEARVSVGAHRLRHLPLALMVAAGRRELATGRRTGRYRASATATNLGRQELAELSGGGFAAARAFVVPPAQPDLPLLLALVGHDSGLDLTGAGPVRPADLRALLADLAAALTSHAVLER